LAKKNLQRYFIIKGDRQGRIKHRQQDLDINVNVKQGRGTEKMLVETGWRLLHQHKHKREQLDLQDPSRKN